jgi:hypothetical protein
MDGISIAQSIAELGILVVIAGIFLWIVIKNNKKQDEFNAQLFKTVIEQMKLCAGGHVLTEEEDKTAVRIDNAIQGLIQKATSDLHCARIMVVRYHNGGKDMNSVSFLKLSVTNESVNYGYKPVMAEFQNQFRSIVGYPVKQIEISGHSYVEDIENIKEHDIGTYELLKSRNVRSYYAQGLVNTNGYNVGAVLVLYHNGDNYQENHEEIHKYLSHLSDQISGLLNVRITEKK